MSFTPTYETVHQETNNAFTNEPSQMLFVRLKHFRETYAVMGTIKTMLYEPMKELKFPPVVFMTIMLIRQHKGRLRHRGRLCVHPGTAADR